MIGMDLNKNKYSLKTLKENIYLLNLVDILRTQRLTARFAVHYILNIIYQLKKEEQEITMEDVIKYQPHITITSLINEQILYESGADSLEDFEEISKILETRYRCNTHAMTHFATSKISITYMGYFIWVIQISSIQIFSQIYCFSHVSSCLLLYVVCKKPSSI